jgi:putative phosphoribosyl transferase
VTVALPFRDRAEAGGLLALQVAETVSPADLPAEQPVVLALPRGGVPVAFEVAIAMGAPLDVIVVRKLGVPSQPELGMGAIGEDGVCVLNPDVIRYLSITERALHRVTEAERAELERRSARYRRDAPMIPLEGRTVVVIDDGLATGSTARAAIEVARAHGARRVALAVPVAPRETVVELGEVADHVICVASPEPFTSIGQWYRDFRQTTDAEVSELLLRARQPRDTDGSA